MLIIHNTYNIQEVAVLYKRTARMLFILDVNFGKRWNFHLMYEINNFP